MRWGHTLERFSTRSFEFDVGSLKLRVRRLVYALEFRGVVAARDCCDSTGSSLNAVNLEGLEQYQEESDSEVALLTMMVIE